MWFSAIKLHFLAMALVCVAATPEFEFPETYANQNDNVEEDLSRATPVPSTTYEPESRRIKKYAVGKTGCPFIENFQNDSTLITINVIILSYSFNVIIALLEPFGYS